MLGAPCLYVEPWPGTNHRFICGGAHAPDPMTCSAQEHPLGEPAACLLDGVVVSVCGVVAALGPLLTVHPFLPFPSQSSAFLLGEVYNVSGYE